MELRYAFSWIYLKFSEQISPVGQVNTEPTLKKMGVPERCYFDVTEAYQRKSYISRTIYHIETVYNLSYSEDTCF